MIRLSLLILSVLSSSVAVSQETWQFLNLPATARQAALSGSTGLIFQETDGFAGNPSFVKHAQPNDIGLTYTSYLADIKMGSTFFVQDFPVLGRTALTATYNNYGDFTGTDILGNKTGTFTAYDLVLGFTSSADVTEFIPLGMSVKWINSSIDSYQSYGLAFDIGTHFYLEEEGLLFTGTLKNAGKQLSGYRISEKLPSKFNLGMFKTLKYMPVSFGVELDDISRLANDTSNLTDYLILSGKLKASQNLVLFASSHLGFRNEIKTSGGIDLSGLNFGASLKVRSYLISYSYANMGIIEGIHRIDFGMNLSQYLN